MAESNDVPTLDEIITEVVETQSKVILSSQCNKVQEYLADKIRKQSEQQKQVRYFINNGNLKLNMEIKNAEREVQSLQCALDTIKAANVELKKDLLLAKERKASVTERVNDGIKKYNEHWRVSKQRYESIPLIQNNLQAKEKNKTLEESILNLTNETQKLRNDIKIRKRELTVLDRKNIIELANFMIHERSQMLQRIQEKNCEVVKLLNDIKNITKEDNTVSNKTATSAPTGMDIQIEDSWPILVLPKLQLSVDEDFDIFSSKLDQIKKKADSQSALKRTESEKLALDLIPTKKIRYDETVRDVYVPSYFNSPETKADDTGTNECHRKMYSEKKLMHIQEDIKLDSVETYNIVSNVKPSSSKHVDVIYSDVQKEPISSKKCDQEKDDTPQDNENIEVIDMTKNQSQNIIIPPTQFLDLSENSQERKEIFDLLVSIGSANIVIDLEKSEDDENDSEDIQNNLLNISTSSDDSYVTIKEIIFMKHNLDQSSQFTYTENSSISTMPQTHAVTSKFFVGASDDVFDNTQKIQVMEIEDNPVENIHLEDQVKTNEVKNTMDNQNVIAKTQKDIPVSGFLFTHGPQGITDSLNISTSMTGFEDTAEDADYPHCIGMKKTGFSFYKKPSSKNRPDTSEKNQNSNFTFSFGRNEKKKIEEEHNIIDF